MSRDLAALLLGMAEPEGQSARLRFGVVRQVSPLLVEVGAGGVPLPVAALSSAFPLAVGARVALLQTGGQLLCLGTYIPSG